MTQFHSKTETHKQGNALVFQDIREVAEHTYEIRFEKPSGFSYTAGQSMKFIIGEERRSFSFLSAPYEEYLRFAFRDSESFFKQTLKSLRRGESVTALGPRGSFVYPDDTTSPVVMIAGGIGITPILSMLKHAVFLNHSERKFTLLYTNRARIDVSYRKELDELVAQLSFLSVRYFLSADANPGFITGRFGVTEFLELYKRMPDALFYAVGTPKMVDETHELLLRVGVPELQIRSRPFTGYELLDDTV